MLRTNYIYIVMLLLLSIVSNQLAAQDNDLEATGEIEDVQVEIIKNREITLPRASRNYDKVPPLPVETVTKDLKYEFKSFSFDVPELDFKLRPLRLKAEPLSKLYNGYVKVGFGNYSTPYFEGYVNNKRDKQYAYGMYAKHLSSHNGPIDEDNSGAGQSAIRVFGNAYGRNTTFGGSLSYIVNKYNYYGYTPGVAVDKDTIDHDLNTISFKTHLNSSVANSAFQYRSSFEFDQISDNYNAKESEIVFNVGGIYAINDESSASLGVNLSIVNQSDASFSSHSRILVTANPGYHFVYNSIDIRAGANIIYADDTLGDMASFRIYPTIEAKYQISSNTSLYGGISGNTERNTYRQLVSQNPYLGANSIIFDSNNQLDIHGGLKSNVSTNLTSEIGFNYKLYKNMYYFNNRTFDQAMFDVLYDTGNTTVTRLFAKLGYDPNMAFSFGLLVELNQYNTGMLVEPWHKPQYRIVFNARYNIFDKIVLGTDLNVLGGIKTQDVTNNTSITLDPVIDLSINAEYRLSDRFSSFIQLKNILANEYEYYNHYPVKGFQVLAGLTYSF